MRSSPRPWTEAETEELLRLRAEGQSHAKISQIIGRNIGSVKGRIRALGFTPEQLESNRAKARVRERRRLYTVDKSLREHKRPRPSHDLLAERDWCFAQPMTPSQLILGDPLPGRSALDKRTGA